MVVWPWEGITPGTLSVRVCLYPFFPSGLHIQKLIITAAFIEHLLCTFPRLDAFCVFPCSILR